MSAMQEVAEHHLGASTLSTEVLAVGRSEAKWPTSSWLRLQSPMLTALYDTYYKG